MLLQTQDAGGPRGQFTFNASGTGLPSETATLSGVANPMASFLLDWPNGVYARPEGLRRTRHEALGDVLLHPGQVAGALEPHDRPRPAVGVLLAARRSGRHGQPRQLRSADPLDSRGRLRRPEQRAERRAEVHELQPAHRRVLASQSGNGPARRLRLQHDSLPGQPLRVQLPGEAELLRVGNQRLPAGGRDVDRLPRTGAPGHPAGWRHSHRGNRASERDARRDLSGSS